MPRREFLGLVGAGAVGLAGCRLMAQQAPTPPAARPNILVIVADDLGYADLGCQGSRDVPTPHIDSLAQNGVRFSDGYVSCPLCSPTRAGLMTGRYQQRFGHEFNPGPAVAAEPNVGLPLSEITVANVLKDAGYTTGIVGKWHLGMSPAFHPLGRGFDEFFGFLGGAHAYYDSGRQPDNPIMRGRQPVPEREYLTLAFQREAVSFLDRHRDHPFFLYLTFNEVHLPMETLPEYLARFNHIADPLRRQLAAKLSAMDDAVGAVLAKLAETGHSRDTLIFFFSDNGGPTDKNGSLNTPLRGYKTNLYEGGIRIPFLCQWPDRIPAGQVCSKPVIQLDILTTAAAATGAKLPTDRVIDGVNLLPFLTGENAGVPHEALLWRFGEQHATRRGDWKVVRPRGGADELYDLAQDISETRNLAGAHPDIVRALSDPLAQWESELAAPMWGSGGGAAQRRPAGGGGGFRRGPGRL
jgi:arylsulfatase A-like enzyme